MQQAIRHSLGVIFVLMAGQVQAAELTAKCKGGTVQTIANTPLIEYNLNGSFEIVYGLKGEKASVAAMSSCGVDGTNGVVVFFNVNAQPASTSAWYSPDCRNVGGNENNKGLSSNVYSPGKGTVLLVKPYKIGNSNTYYSPDCRCLGGGGADCKTVLEPF